MTDPNALAAKAWEAIHRFDADAIPPGIRADEIAAIAAVYAPLVESLSDNGELLTIAWMDGSHSSNTAHRARIAELEAEVERLRDGLAGAIAAISDPRGLDDAICCSGHMCGCRGSSHRELLLHDLSEVLARAALKGTRHDA